MTTEMINIGRVVGTYGVQGAVKVVPMTDFPERFQKMRSVLLNVKGNTSQEKVEWTREHGTLFLVKFQRFTTPEEALKIKGAYLQITPQQLHPLPEGEYYIFQLTGLAVHDGEKGYLGEITEVLQTGANDVYVVQGGPFGEVLLPALKQVIKRVDLEAGRMDVCLLPGLLPEEDKL